MALEVEHVRVTHIVNIRLRRYWCRDAETLVLSRCSLCFSRNAINEVVFTHTTYTTYIPDSGLQQPILSPTVSTECCLQLLVCNSIVAIQPADGCQSCFLLFLFPFVSFRRIQWMRNRHRWLAPFMRSMFTQVAVHNFPAATTIT